MATDAIGVFALGRTWRVRYLSQQWVFADSSSALAFARELAHQREVAEIWQYRDGETLRLTA